MVKVWTGNIQPVEEILGELKIQTGLAIILKIHELEFEICYVFI